MLVANDDCRQEGNPERALYSRHGRLRADKHFSPRSAFSSFSFRYDVERPSTNLTRYIFLSEKWCWIVCLSSICPFWNIFVSVFCKGQGYILLRAYKEYFLAIKQILHPSAEKNKNVRRKD